MTKKREKELRKIARGQVTAAIEADLPENGGGESLMKEAWEQGEDDEDYEIMHDEMRQMIKQIREVKPLTELAKPPGTPPTFEVEYGHATVRLGDNSWHEGPGWYYVMDDYPGDGSCGAFATRLDAVKHAEECGFIVRNKVEV